MSRWKRVTALLLSVAIMLSLLPAGALAAEPWEDADAEETFVTLEEEDIFESSDAADSSDTAESILQEESRTGASIAANDGGDAEDEPAYEVSYNLSGSGYWVTVGSDETLKDEASYQLFDEDGNYAIQLREEDTFPYKVEMRSRTEKNALWSVPETVTFTGAGETKEFAGHKFTAHSKWIMDIQYTLPGSSGVTVSANEYDDDGNYTINLSDDDISFPMTLKFKYRYSGNGWTTVEFPTADGKGTTTDIVFNDMNASADVMGHIFTLHSDLLGMAQYSVDDRNNWQTVGAGQEREFDKNGNYTIDMGSRKDFPITVYLRYLDVDGWKYVGNADNTAASYQDYRNVLDTASVGGHVFAIHTDWMYDVKYAIVEESDIVSGHFVVPQDSSPRWKIVGVGKDREGYDIDYCYDASGNYAVNVMKEDGKGRDFPLQILFKAISPTGEWPDDGGKWEDEGRLKDHLRTYSDVNDIKQFENHDFSLRYADLSEVQYRILTKYSDETKKYPADYGWVTVGNNQTRAENDRDYRLFNEFGNYNISLTDEELKPDEGLFPLRVEFRWMEANGWIEKHSEIPFSNPWETVTVSVSTHTFGFNPLDFLDDVRYQRDGDGDNNWMYFIPDPGEDVDPKKVRYYPNYSVYTTDETGTSHGVIPMRESDTFEKISDDKYALKPGVIFQTWDPESGWIPQTVDDYNSLNDSRIVKTCLGIPHTFTLQPVYDSEVRYSLTSANGPWIVVGEDKIAAQEALERDSENPDYVLFDSKGDYTISLPREKQFPVRAFFEVYTKNGWVKASGTQTPFGTGTFQNASGTLPVKADSGLHTFHVSYPWADSVSYTFEDRQPKVTYTVGSDSAYAEKDDTYFYAAPGSTYTIELDEGDFFPVKISFFTTDNKGQVSRRGTQPQSSKVEDYVHEFTTNQADDTYTVGGYTFNVNSNWMGTVRIYLPERTVSVGTGEGITPEWLEKNKNYNLFDTDDGSYTIPLRPSDTFPLEVEFLKRSVDADPRPIKHTFENVTDTFVFDGHTFKLDYDFSDTVRYILARDEDVADEDGNLNQGYASRIVTVVGDAKFAAEHNGYEAFDKDGNFTIPLPENSALPVDAWFALPDANGSYDDSTYTKYTFWKRTDVITPAKPQTVLEDPETSGTPAPAGTATPSPMPTPVTPPRQEHQFSVYAEWMDEVFYTLPKLPNRASLPDPKEITVGPDKERAAAEEKTAAAEIREPVYVTYGSDGSYTIQLEDDAFFPYVIDFRYRLPGREKTEVPVWDNNGNLVLDENNNVVMRVDPYKGDPLWKDGKIEFLTPDSQKWINGHLFKIASTRTNPNAAVRIDLVMGNHRVPLRLAGMPDTPDQPVGGETVEDLNALEEAAKLQSTQPLPEVQLYADINGVFDEEVANTRVEVYMPNLATQKEELAKQVVWGEWDMGNYDEKDYFIPNNNKWNQLRESVHYQQLSNGLAADGKRLDLRQYAQTQREADNRKQNGLPLDYQYFEVITGSGDQLDTNNIRYVIRTSIVTPNYTDLVKMKVAYVDVRRGGVPVSASMYEPARYFMSEGYESAVSTKSRSAYRYTDTASDKTRLVDVYRITVNETWRDGKLWLTMKANENSASYDAFKNLDAEVYEGFYFTQEEVKQAKNDGKNRTTLKDDAGGTLTIREVAWNQELDTQRVDRRYAYPGDFLNGTAGIENGPKFTIVWTRPGESEPVSIMPFRVLVDVDTNIPVVVDPENPEQLPVTFRAPHTHSDFIRDDDGNMPPVKYLTRQDEYISEYTNQSTGEKTSFVTSVYWTQADGNLYDDRYYVQADYHLSNSPIGWKDDGIRVFAGTVPFNTVEEAEEAVRKNDDTRAMDVTEQIFVFPGFGADYSKDYSDGVVFSVFNRSGTLLAQRKIQTVRREFLDFGPLSRQGLAPVESNQAISRQIYEQNVRYDLPKSEYRGIFKGRSRYTIPVTYLRDFVPSNFTDYGVKLVVGCRRAYDTYEEAISSPEHPTDIDIAKQAKTGASGVEEIAYTAPYRNGITFALYSKDGTLLDYRTVTAVEPEMSDKTDIYLYGAQSTSGRKYKAYVMPGNMDSYFGNGYQTVFILNRDGTPVTDSQIVPLFENSRRTADGVKARIYASVYNPNGAQAAGELQTSGQTPLPFSAEAGAAPYHYTAAATNELNAKEYYVTYVTQQKGPKLFVNTANSADNLENGIPKRQVFIQGSESSAWQDIFIANIGDEPLENITVTFDPGENGVQELRVDDVWKIENTVTLPAFTTTDIEEAPGHGRYDPDGENWFDPDVQLPNVAKIRLYPQNADNASGIDDILIIQAHDSGGNVTDESKIMLSGIVGDIKITTDVLTGPDAVTPEGYDDYTKEPVKYVAFSRMLQTNMATDLNTNGVTFSITEGRLPSGFPEEAEYDPNDENLQQIKPNGEIFGVPLETGTFTFTVTATYRYPVDSEEPVYFSQDSKTYTLNVRDNTKENVEDMISKEYEVISWVPDMIITSDEVIEGDPVIGGPGGDTKSRQDVEEVTLDGYRDVVFEYKVGDGITDVDDYDWVVDVYLNGQKLERGKDYTVEDHSAYIPISAQKQQDMAKASDANDFEFTGDVSARQNGDRDNTNTRNASFKYTVHKPDSSSPTGTPANPTTRPGSPTSVPTPRPTATPSSSSGNGGGSSSGGRRTRTTATPTPSRRNPTSTPTPRATATPTQIPSYTVTIRDAQNGRVSVSSTSARRGTTVTVNTTPNKGYVTERVDVLYGGSTLTATKNVDNQYTFSMPGANVTVVGIFAPERLSGFTDIDGTNTFFDDAKWSYERGILRGTTDTTWEPDGKISSVTSIVTLGRLMDVDTSQFAGEEYRQSWIPAGEWYTPDAQWAAYYRILTPETFTGRDPIRRGSLALMLRNYLAYQGINLVVADDERVTFADMDRMSPEEVEAFQILRKAGVFLGDTDGRMYPDHDTTRGNLAAILHRIYTFMFDYWREHADDT